MKNKKIFASVIIIPLLTFSFATFANDSSNLLNHSDRESVIDALLNWNTLTTEQESIKVEMIQDRADRSERESEHEEIRNLEEKVRNWETLTEDEQSVLDEFTENRPTWPGLLGWPIWKIWDEKGIPKHLYDTLSDDEKSTFDNMSDSEKQSFLETRMEEEKTYREEKETVMFNLVNWIELNSKQEEIREEIKNEMDEKIKMEAEHEKIRIIEEKDRNWETLTEDEQSLLDTFHSNRP